MPPTRTALRLAASLAALAPPLRTQQPAPPAPATPVHVYHAAYMARTLRTAGDTAAALRALQAGDSLSPGHPVILTALLEHHALVNDTTSIVATLRRVAELGVLADPLGLPSIRAWRVVPAVSLVGVVAREAAAPLVRSDTVLVLPDRGLVPEALAWDATRGIYYVGSYGRGLVLRVAPRRAATPFVSLEGSTQPAGTAPRYRVLGVKIDSARGLLWAAVVEPSAAAPRGVTGRPGGWASLHAYDLSTGKLRRRVAPADSARAAHLLNDMAVARDGDVYVTDSEGGAVFRVPAARDTLETVYAGDRGFVYPNGIALSADGRRLWVAHAEGVALWELPERGAEGAPRRVARRIAAPGFVGDIDGLVACRDALIAIQSAGDHHRVVRLRLTSTGERVTALEVLERRHPAYDTPTVGTLVGNDLVYIANSGVARVRADGTIDPAAPAPEPVLLRLAACPPR